MSSRLQRRAAEVLGVVKKRGLVLLPQEIAEIEHRIGIVFRDKTFLDQAFIHRSYLNENRNLGLESNERIEFLGDCVQEFVVGEYLYRQLPDTEEGLLTAYRSALVNNRMLAAIYDEIKLAPFLRMSRGERRYFDRGDRSAQYIKGNGFEALVGAIFLDRGVGTVELFLGTVMLPKLTTIISEKRFLDAKSRFQELAQERLRATPQYQVLDESGPDHNKSFLVGVFIGERLVAQGTGPSKVEAEKEAAKAALQAEFQVEMSE